jgi:hypothetical protein
MASQDCSFNLSSSLQDIYYKLYDDHPPNLNQGVRWLGSNNQPKTFSADELVTDVYFEIFGRIPPDSAAVCGAILDATSKKITISISSLNPIIVRPFSANINFSSFDCQSFSLEVVGLPEKKIILYTENLLDWLLSQEVIPEKIRKLPEEEKEALKNFWAMLITEEKLVDQLFKPLQTLQLDSDEATTPPDKSTEKIFEAIKAEVEKTKSPVEENVIKMINQLSDTAKTWLGQLLLHLVKNPGLRTQLQTELQGYLTPFLLFGQTPAHIVPRAWIEASWNYIHHFRCNFGFSAIEAMQYPKITIVGTPDVPVPVTGKEEKFLRDYLNDQPDEHKLERLWVRSAQELKALLDDRVARNISFEGGDVGPHVPQ